MAAHKTPEIRWSAIGVLANFVAPTLEEYYKGIIHTDADSIVIVNAIEGLGLNGTESSVELLMEVFKKSRDGQVRGTIIASLRSIYLRNALSEACRSKLFTFIGNSYPFFQGFWNDIKKAKPASKLNWSETAAAQLATNNLNLIFGHSDEIDFHIQIEKMNSHFIRYINVTAIYKTGNSPFSKYYTPGEFYLSENKLFDSLFDKTKQMRPDAYTAQITGLIDTTLIPKLTGRIEMWHALGTMPFSEFETNQATILQVLFGTDRDFVVAPMLTTGIDRLAGNPDKNKYIDYVIQKWENCKVESFKIKTTWRNRK
ncbi:MAG: HEAT repeat domain-containing protein [Chitinophagaceae bacterium]|nr:HEAT repeat domain-containing protein [Chitinophagaceae bacterium]